MIDPDALAIRMVALALDLDDEDDTLLKTKARQLFDDLVADETDIKVVFQAAAYLSGIVAGVARSVAHRQGLDPVTLVAQMAGA